MNIKLYLTELLFVFDVVTQKKEEFLITLFVTLMDLCVLNFFLILAS